MPIPSKMPVDTSVWKQQLDISNFINAYYQYRDLQRLPNVHRILIVGPGQGLGTCVLRWRGYEVETFDIDPEIRPDYLGSVHDLSLFKTGSFDAVVASHVLEHLPLKYLDRSLAELARVARYTLLYLPIHGRHVQVRFIPGFRGINLSAVLDLFNYFERPDGNTARYMAGQHYWEVGMRGFRVGDLTRRLRTTFEVLNSYRNNDWLSSYNFVLKSREHRGVQVG